MTNVTPFLVLAGTLMGEASTEGAIGMRGVASVIWERAEDRSPEGLARTCLAPKQFSCWNGAGGRALALRVWGWEQKAEHARPSAYAAARRIAAEMAVGAFHPLPGLVGCRHYHRFDCTPAWAKKMPVVMGIGAHVFRAERRGR